MWVAGPMKGKPHFSCCPCVTAGQHGGLCRSAHTRFVCHGHAACSISLHARGLTTDCTRMCMRSTGEGSAPRARAQGPQLAVVVPTRELGVQTALLARAPTK